jgi:hypothetical protein
MWLESKEVEEGGITEDDRGEKNNENEKCEFYTLF